MSWLTSGLAVKQEPQDEADHQTFSEGKPEHLVLAQTKLLPDPLNDCLVPKQERVCLLGRL